MRPSLRIEDLVAALLDVAQEVRREDDADVARVADLADQPEHARRAGGSRPFVGSSRNSSLRPVRDRLRELGELLHAERVGLERPVARLAEADVEERLVRALERLPEGSPESSAIMRTKRTAGHVGDEGVVLGHVADGARHLAALRADVAAEERAVPADGGMKPSSVWRSVVLPAPFGPRRPMERPARVPRDLAAPPAGR